MDSRMKDRVSNVAASAHEAIADQFADVDGDHVGAVLTRIVAADIAMFAPDRDAAAKGLAAFISDVSEYLSFLYSDEEFQELQRRRAN